MWNSLPICSGLTFEFYTDLTVIIIFLFVWTVPLITCWTWHEGLLQCHNLTMIMINVIKMSVLPSSISSSFLALLVILDVSFACSYVLSVLWKVCHPAKTFPTHSFSGVCPSVSLTHINMPLSLSVVSPPLSPSRTSGGSLVFVWQKCASGLCCVKVLPTVSSLLKPLAIYSPFPPLMSPFL